MTLLIALTACSAPKPDFPKQGEIGEVPFNVVHIQDQFWAERIEINRTVSIPSAFHQCEVNGRFDNFALAGGLIRGEHRGDFSFDDTDPYKVIEGASYSLAAHYDEHLDHYLDSVITLIAAAQEADGYLTTCVTNRCARLSGWWGTHRWEKINSHELYNSGHLYEAAVAHYRATGKRSLLDVAIRNADLVCQVFGPNEGQIHRPSGHPIIEMALVKLYKVTGTQRYLDEAKYFVEETGRCTDGHRPSMYSQDHLPILEQDEIVGHAVRAGYLYSGVADVAALTHDDRYQQAITRIWDNMASRKLYITGGIGSRAQGEGFGPDYELNNHTAYCETCASIANVYWNYRMFLATGEAKYADVYERALYNGVLSGVSLSGDRFFYDNPLESMGQHERAAWFGCACCPGNITRFVASVPQYMYARSYLSADSPTDVPALYVNLYIQSEASIELADTRVRIEQQTQYPWQGDVRLTVTPAETREFALRLRIPGWAKGKPVPTDLYGQTPIQPYQVKLNGQSVASDYNEADGYFTLVRRWQAGDCVELSLPMEVLQIAANDAVEDNRGKLAVERGPVVYCLEGVDMADSTVFDKVIPAGTSFTAQYEPELLGGVMTLRAPAQVLKADSSLTDVEVKLIPYCTWQNRGASQMEVWIPAEKASARITPEPTIAPRARSLIYKAPIQKDAPISASAEEWAWGVNDQWEPRRSSDTSKPYHYWWLQYGCPVTLSYEFAQPETLTQSSVYWLDFDHYDGNFRTPASWRLYYRNAQDRWEEVTLDADSQYGVAKDQYNTVSFQPITTTALRIVAQLQEGQSGGVIEWKVE